jgi:glycine cleavage system H lipoate-binding protein
MEILNSLRYSSHHDWAHDDGNNIHIGLTPIGVEQLGGYAILNLQFLCSVGNLAETDNYYATTETGNMFGEIRPPVSGRITEINFNINVDLLTDAPYSVWLIKLASTPTNRAELNKLMDSTAYQKFVASW